MDTAFILWNVLLSFNKSAHFFFLRAADPSRTRTWYSRVLTTDSGLLLDAIALSGIVGLAFALCWAFPTPFWIAELTVYGIPLTYLLARSESVRAALDLRFLAKAIVFCAVFYTYVGLRYEGWTAPSQFPTIFGVPIEQAAWGALVIPLSIAVAQRFFASPLVGAPLPRTRQIIYVLFVLGLALAVIPPLRNLMAGYVYLKIGLVLYPVIFLLAIRLGRPFIRELFLTGLIFFALHLCFEMLAMHHGYWGFQGEYIGWVQIPGYRIPIEELVFILALSSPTAVAVHGLRSGWKGLPTPLRPR
ncbi:MAG TPA: hypothetical protein VFZ19_02200 [Solirubrobacterales bacterium]